MEAVLAYLMLLVVPGSLVLNLWLKPRFWLPSFIVYAVASIVVLVAALALHWPALEVAKAAVLFGFLFFAFSVFVGRILQKWFFPVEYAEQAQANTESKWFPLRSKIVGAVALLAGAGLAVALIPPSAAHEWILLSFAVVVALMGLAYVAAPGGGATVLEWRFLGIFVRGRKR